ncbi:MAG: HD domain-containing protein [Butyrivibrio sp.]|nr:HD domain-containing protein [Butyrivibrio sp.]
MEILRDKEARPFKVKLFYMSCLCILGVAINVCGLNLADSLALPLYLDSIGTVIAAYLGGPIPGILVGMLGSFLSTFSDPVSISYGVLNVLVAVLTVALRDLGWFKSPKKAFLSVFIYACIGGFLGGILSWGIYGIESEVTSVGLASFLFKTGLFGAIPAQVLADYIIDFADKGIDVIVIVLLDRFATDSFKRKFVFDNWQQAPLSDEALLELNRRRFRKMSIRFKINILIIFASCLTALTAILISFYLYTTSTIKQHGEYATNIANTAALVVNGDRVNEFLVKGEEAYGYDDTRELLKKIVNDSEYLEFLYVYKYVNGAWRCVFDIDNNGVKSGEVGEIVPIEEALLPNVYKLQAGEAVDVVVTNDEYGWLLTAYVPVEDSEGKTVAYACADISMKPIQLYSRTFFVSQLAIFLSVFIFIFVVGLTFAEYHIILPLNAMAYTASEFSAENNAAILRSADDMKSLKISTGDEIENLYHAFYSMTEANRNYIEDINKKNDTIGRMQNALIRVLADMVESRDHNTGDHVMKTAEYVKIIMDEMKKEGIYKEQLTDEFMEDVYLAAPLHDIGKISISDTILNYPGKLSAEQFEIMKTHPSVGADIIERVISKVPGADSEYLKEARKLALYHHEKWDGSGYPKGLKGEEIPLSARIMAVADVFDAIVSERAYKKAFPFDKAMDIIRESSGSHFDPNVAGAFLNAENEVRRVYKSGKKAD